MPQSEIQISQNYIDSYKAQQTLSVTAQAMPFHLKSAHKEKRQTLQEEPEQPQEQATQESMTIGVSHAFCIEQLHQCLTFSQDDASDPQILLRLMEQAIGVKVDLDCSKLQNHTISEFLSLLID